MRKLFWLPALASVALLASCGFKDSSFFAPEYTTVDRLPDITPPQFSNYKPLAVMTGVYNVSTFTTDFTDVVPANGVPASGVDAASVKATIGAGLPLALTRAGDTYSASLAGVADGSQTIRLEGKDVAGNAATGSMTLTLDRTPPNINVMERPLTSFTSNAGSNEVSWRFGITDPNLMNAVGAIYRPGVDNTCGTNDDVLVPKGTGPDQISENSWTYSSMNASNVLVRYTTYSPVAQNDSSQSRTQCFIITANDNAIGVTGLANPNTAKSALSYTVIWVPPPPPAGTIRGTVFRDGVPASGVTVTLGALVGANRTAQTNSAGAYVFTNVQVGIRTLGVTPPAGTVCEPSVGIATVTANNVSTVDFGCNTPAGSIAGRVTLGSVPLAGVTITVNGRTQMSDADGRYVFTGLAPGLYTVLLTNIPSTANCSVAALLVTVASGAQAAANFACEAKPAILKGIALIEGQPAAGYRIVLNTGAFRVTGADGRYEFSPIAAGQYTMIISQIPANVICNPADVLVSVVASETTVQDFACGTPAIATSYFHLSTSSVVCVQITMHHSLGIVPYQVRVTGPGVVGSSTKTGSTAAGFAFVKQDINTYGTYLANVTIGGLVMLPRQQIVTAAPGTCVEPLSVR